MRVVFAAPARQDLEDIVDYLRQFNPASARQVVKDIRQACADVSKIPSLGHIRAELCEFTDVRVIVARRTYLVIYRCSGQVLPVLRVIHGARDLGRAMGSTPGI